MSDNRGVEIARRMDRLGVPVREMARRVGMDRGAVTRARRGRAHTATYGRLEAELDALEEEMGADAVEHVSATVTLPGGAEATVTGTPQQVAETVRALTAGSREASEVKFLQRRD